MCAKNVEGIKVYTKPLENLTTTIKASDVTTVYNGGK